MSLVLVGFRRGSLISPKPATRNLNAKPSWGLGLRVSRRSTRKRSDMRRNLKILR